MAKIIKTGKCQYKDCGKDVASNRKYCGSQAERGSCAYLANLIKQQESYFRKYSKKRTGKYYTNEEQQCRRELRNLLSSGYF